MTWRTMLVLAWVCVVGLALCGCGKGNQQASSESPEKAETVKTDSKSAKSSPKKAGKPSGTKEAVKGKTTGEREQTSKVVELHDTSRSGVLTEADNELEYTFRQGQTITVVLGSNKDSGLSWSLVEPMGNVIVPVGTGTYTPRTGKKATGGTETWRFRAARPGYQTVRMEYRRRWAQSVPERTFRFSGTVR